MAQVLLEIREASVADEILFRGEGDEVGPLALVAQKLCVVGRGELNEAGKVVLLVEFEERLKGDLAGECERVSGLGLGGLSLEYKLVLLVAGAEGGQTRSGSVRFCQVARVAEVGLGLSEGGSRHGRR